MPTKSNWIRLDLELLSWWIDFRSVNLHCSYKVCRRLLRAFFFLTKLWSNKFNVILLTENFSILFPQTAVLTVLLFPIRVILMIVLLLVAYAMAYVAIYGHSREELKLKPLSGWRWWEFFAFFHITSTNWTRSYQFEAFVSHKKHFTKALNHFKVQWES